MTVRSALLLASLFLIAPALADDNPKGVPQPKRDLQPKTGTKEAHTGDAQGKKQFDYAVDLQGTLYRIQCDQQNWTPVGKVQVPAGKGTRAETPTLCDLGATADGYLYGVSTSALYLINQEDPSKSKRIGSHGVGAPYGMAAVGVSLLCNTAGGQVYLLDRKTAKATLVGNMGGSFGASGDIAFLGDTIYSSVKDGQGRETLVKLDPKTGKATKIGVFKDPMNRPIPNVFGLIDRKGILYGTLADGRLVRIETSNARCVVLKDASISWWGATSFTRF